MSPSKTSGQYHEQKGGIKETVGNALGLGGTHNSGQTERYEGQGEYDASRAQGYTQGAGDRVTGKKDSVVGSATGDHSQQHSGEARENKGDWKQSINRKL
ncbi:hypothetical protein GGG16DRAFT_120163 [Schizophyllum commune]